jgi:hypothetical protein
VSHFHVLCSQTIFRRCGGRSVPFSCFALPDSFSTLPRALCPVFIFCALGHIFGGTVVVWSRFLVLRYRTRFLRYRGREVPFTCFARPNSFSAVPRPSGPVFMFCAPALVFYGTDDVGSNFHVLRSRTRFRRCGGRRVPFSCFALPDTFSECGGRRVPFSCFALPDTFSAVSRASGPIFMSSAPGHVFGGAEGVRSRFHVLRSRTLFRRYRERHVPFSCFFAPGHIFDGTEGVGSRFHVLRSRSRFRRY